MAEVLSIVVMNFEGAVVHMGRGIGTQKKRVVIRGLISKINVGKNGDYLPSTVVGDVDEVRRNEIERCRVECNHFFELGGAFSKVAQLY